MKLPVTELERVDFSRRADRVKRFLGSGDIRLQSRESSEGGCGSRVARYWGAPCVAQGAPAWDCTSYWYCGTVTPIRHATAEPISGGSHTSRTAVRVAVRGR